MVKGSHGPMPPMGTGMGPSKPLVKAVWPGGPMPPIETGMGPYGCLVMAVWPDGPMHVVGKEDGPTWLHCFKSATGHMDNLNCRQ